MNFIEIVDRIFVNRNLYHEVTDEDKISSFFIINRKFGKRYPKVAQQFNHKFVDKASAIDMWYELFKNQKGIPQWYWDPKSRVNPIKVNKKSNYDLIKIREELEDFDMKYLEKFFEDDLKKELKRLNKFDQ